MSKGIISLLLMSTILLAGCKNSNTTATKIPIPKEPLTISSKAAAKVSSSYEKSDTTPNAIIENKDGNASIKLPPLISTENTKITDNIKSVVDSIDSVLDSQDETKELN